MDKTTLAGRTILSAMLLSLGSSQIVWALDVSGDTSIPPILSWDYYNESYYGKDFVNNIILGSQSYNTINGSGNIILNSGGRSSGGFNTVNGDSVNIGSNIYTEDKSTGIGTYVFAGSGSIAIGYDIYNHKDVNGISYYTQDNIKHTGGNSVALGRSIEANGYGSIALGHSVKANGMDSIAIGSMTAALGQDSVAIGSGSYASTDSVVSFGHKSGDDATMLGITDSDVDTNGKYKNTLTRRLVNVTDGINNSDAATKGQVITRATFSDNILTLARNNGKDNVTVDLSELVTDDSLFVKYTDNTKSAVDIGSASFSTTGVGSFGSVSVGGNTYIDNNGINANSKVISNVAAAVKDTDAVNKKQMEDADSKVLKDSKEYTDVKVTDLEAKDALNVKYTDNTKSAVDIGNASFSTTGVGSFGSVSVGGNTYIDNNGINANSKVISNVAAAVKDTDAVNKKQMEDADSKVLKDSKEYTDVKVTDLEAKDALNVKYTDNTKSAVDIGNASFSTTGVGSFGSVSVGGNTYIDSNGINANNKVISNVAGPVKDTDAANKSYVDVSAADTLQNAKDYTDGKVADLAASDSLSVKYTDNTKSAVDIGNASFSTTGVGDFGSISVGGNAYIDSNGINANNKVISNVAGPVKGTDAANKSYVDVSAANTLQNAKDYTDGKVADLTASDSLSVKYTDNTKSAVDIGSASISTTGRGNFGSISVGGNTYIDDKGIDANSKVISNVAAAVKDSDAVNKKQMEAADDKILETSKVYTDTKIKNVTVDSLREANDYTDMRFNNLDQKINKTGAATAAMAGLHPLDFDEEQKLNFAVATGGYHGSSAIALGMFYRPNENVMFNLSGSTSGSEHMYSLGASFALDRPSDTHVSSRRALTEKVQQLSKVNEAVIKQSMELQAKNDELQSQIAELRQIVMEMKKSA